MIFNILLEAEAGGIDAAIFCFRSLMWLKAGNNLTVERTLLHLQMEVKKTEASTKSVKLLDLFRDRATIKGLIIVLGLFIGQQFCGIFAMVINYHFTHTHS